MLSQVFTTVRLVLALCLLTVPLAAEADDSGLGQGCNFATGFLQGEYGPMINAVVPSQPDPTVPVPIEELLENLEELLKKYNIDPNKIDLDLLKRNVLEELRKKLREQGLSESLIDLILWAFRNGIGIPNPFGDPDIKKYNEALDVIAAIERFLKLLRKFDLDEELLSMNDFRKFLEFADKNSECGNNDGQTTLEEIICYIQYLEDNSTVEGWEDAYKDLIKEINELRKLLGLPPLEHPFIIGEVATAATSAHAGGMSNY